MKMCSGARPSVCSSDSTRSADVAVGLEIGGHHARNGLGRHETLVGVEVVPHLQPVRVLGVEGGEGGIENDRGVVAVGVEEPY